MILRSPSSPALTAIAVHFDSYEETIRDLHSQIIALATGGSAGASYEVKIVLMEA